MRNILYIPKRLALAFILRTHAIWWWWIGEISGMIPKRWTSQRVWVAEMSGETFIFTRKDAKGKVAEAAQPVGKTVNLRISNEAVLHRTLNLPLSARFKLPTILANDLERQSPVNPSEVMFTYHILSVDRIAARLNVSLVMIRRDLVERAVAGLNSLGFKVRNICALDLYSGREDRMAATKQGSIRRVEPGQPVAAVLLLLAATLLTAAIFLRFSQQEAFAARLSNEAAQLETASSSARQLQRQLSAVRGQADFLALQRERPGMGVIFAEITRLLPDGTWLSSFTYDGKQLEIQGYSTQAAQLPAILESSKRFSEASFRAPMTQGPQPGVEQFDLSMNLAGQ